MKVKQRVILYRSGINKPTETSIEVERAKRVAKNPTIYEDCPRCSRKYAVKKGKMVIHMIDFKNRIPCMPPI